MPLALPRAKMKYAQSPAALASLERLDLASSYFSTGRTASPTASSVRGQTSFGSPPFSPSLIGRRRRPGPRHSGSRPRIHSAPGSVVDEDSDVDDLVILLHSPALEPSALGLGISSASSDAETEPDEEGQTILIPTALKVQPATPDE